MKDRYREFARDSLASMGCAKLEALLREAPLTRDPEERRLRNACWAEVVRHCGCSARAFV
jgi:hypothetical protein